MNTSEKPSDKAPNAISHAFPSLQETASDINAECADGADSAALFQPMFKEGISRAVGSINGTRDSSENKEDDPLENARRAAYQRGVTEGNNQACLTVQKNLSPIILDLTDTLKQFDAYRQGVGETCSHISLKLALHIVEKISGMPSTLQLEDLSEVGTLIQDSMANDTNLSLTFNPKELNFLNELSACDNALVWEKYIGVTVNSDSAVESGEIKASENMLPWETVNEQVASLLDKIFAQKRNPPD